MIDDHESQRSKAHEDLEREIREGRKFTAKEALARLAGPGAMKGASPVSPVRQAETEIGNWLKSNVPDSAGALQMLLQRNLRGSELLLANLDWPLAALAGYCEHVLESEHLLRELVRRADVEWGQRMDERPRFERQGSADPEDPYTFESVRSTLAEALKRLGH
jgi:hypothetical protein